MPNHTGRALRAIAIGALLAAGWGPAQMALAASPCDNIADPMQRAQCNCAQGQSDYASQTSAIVSQQAQADPYLQAAHSVIPGSMASLGVPGVTQSCNSVVKDAFNSVMSQASGVFGFDLGSIFGSGGPLASMAGSAEGQLCQDINNAIMSRATVSCPRISIPGYPIACGATVGLSASGLTASGAVNGYGTSAGVGVGGAAVGATGPGMSGTGATIGTGSIVSNAGGVASSVACWFTGNC